MIGGLLKSTSRLALAASAAMFVGGVAIPSAQAADLGGDCCADLEERVAELEATTARKGNRKMSLTITGQVHRIIMWWDDGKSNRTYYGTDNTNSSSRFSLLGEAKVTPNVKMGFEIMLEVTGARSASVNQWDADGTPNSRINPVGAKPITGNQADPIFGTARRIAWWIEDAKLGRVTVGRYEMAGAVTTIDLGGISAGASASEGLVNGGFLLRGPAGQYYGINWGNITDPAANQARQNEIRYDSPTFAGFIVSASLAEDGSDWGAMLRYANEFGGLRVAAGIGYEHYGQVSAGQTCINVSTTSTTQCTFGTGLSAGSGYGPINLNDPTPNVNGWGGGLSVLHVPTGLFVQGHYLHADFDENSATTFSTAGFWGQTKQGLRPADQWLIQGGITKNWFGIGNTALFGEYSRNTGWGAAGGPLAPAGASYSVSTIPGATAVNGVTDTEMTMYGFGVTQNVDAAATELYLDYRHFSGDITCSSTGFNCSGSAATIGTVGLQKLQTEDFWVVIGGARMKF
jgi:hypothetical protein